MFFRISALFVLFVVQFFAPTSALAAGEFKADYSTKYAISPEGNTTVTQSVSLTNLFSHLYPKEYTVILDSDDITNVIATDATGVVTPVVNRQDGKTHITMNFAKPSVGVGKQTSFTIRYENGDIAKRLGRIWEVHIPGVLADPDMGAYTVSFDVPSSFGAPVSISPPPLSGLVWTKEELTRGGIVALYGDFERYDITLSYYLANSGLTNSTKDVTLPPDTAYQRVAIESIEPSPDRVTRSGDGNWIASFTVPANGELSISAHLVIDTYPHPRESFAEKNVVTSEYLSALPYWEANDARIMALAQTYTTPRAIYEYVVQTLTYNEERVYRNPVRLGATGILDTPSEALCNEFTDLFVAVARAAGIPARASVGYALTTNPRLRPLSFLVDVLHRWPEYYDSERSLWIPVDPTWGNTTGGVNYFDSWDMNHIVFAIQGLESELPLPAGFYRRPNSIAKDVLVKFREEEPTHALGKITTQIHLPTFGIAGLPFTGTLELKNTGGLELDAVSVAVHAADFGFTTTSQYSDVAPLASFQIPIRIPVDTLWTFRQGTLVVNVNDEILRRPIVIYPFYVLAIPGIIGVVFIVVFVYGLKKLFQRKHSR